MQYMESGNMVEFSWNTCRVPVMSSDLPQHQVLSARADPTGKPHEMMFRHCLRTHTAPQNFTPKVLYDEKAIMFTSHNLDIISGVVRGGA